MFQDEADAQAFLTEHAMLPEEYALFRRLTAQIEDTPWPREITPFQVALHLLVMTACASLAQEVPGDPDELAERSLLVTRIVEAHLYANIYLTCGFTQPLPENTSENTSENT